MNLIIILLITSFSLLLKYRYHTVKILQQIKYIENRQVAMNTMLVSGDIAILHTNIPQEGQITIVCRTYETVHLSKPCKLTPYLRDILRLLKLIFKHTLAQWAQRWQSFASISVALVKTEIINRSDVKCLTWKRYMLMMSFLYGAY